MFYLYFKHSDDKFGQFLHVDYYFYPVDAPDRPDKLEFKNFDEIANYISNNSIPEGKYLILNENIMKVGSFVHIDIKHTIDKLTNI